MKYKYNRDKCQMTTSHLLSPDSRRVLSSGWKLDSARLLAEDLLPASQAPHQGPVITQTLTNSRPAPAVWTNQSPSPLITTQLPHCSALLISYPSVTYAPGPLSPVTRPPPEHPVTGPPSPTCRVTRRPGPVTQTRGDQTRVRPLRSSRPMPHRVSLES